MKEIILKFKALSDPTRMRLLWLLQIEEELCVCDLVAALDLPQSTVSRHLAYLRYAGLVSDNRKGVWMYYRLTDSAEAFVHQLMELVNFSGQASGQAETDRLRLKEYLETKCPGACAENI